MPPSPVAAPAAGLAQRLASWHRLGVVLLLGFASGLPLALTGQAMQAWLSMEGLDVATIGFLSLVGLPYTFKFLWAPLMDRFDLPWLGRRRGWLVLTQLALAASLGAAAAMVDRAWAAANPVPLPLLVVDDTRIGLGQLAAGWRERFELPLIGVTGSNGKTTVKEMCAAILRAQARREGRDPDLAVLATRGNLNNDIGLPLMLLRLSGNHRAAVIEMGMNHPGEIGYLTRLAAPTVALVNNAQRAHLEGMGSVNEVAREKGAIYEGLSTDGVAVVNADDAFAGYWKALNAGRRVLTFGLRAGADVTAQVTSHGFASDLVLASPKGAASFRLQVPGEHNVRNALAAAAACLAAGALPEDVAAGLGGFSGTPSTGYADRDGFGFFSYQSLGAAATAYWFGSYTAIA